MIDCVVVGVLAFFVLLFLMNAWMAWDNWKTTQKLRILLNEIEKKIGDLE